MWHSWGSMLRTVRAPLAVILLGGIGLTVPPQTRNMLAFLDESGPWPVITFLIVLIVLAASAWFWSRAAARFGIDDAQRYKEGRRSFDWFAFTWLPRLMLAGSFLVGAIMALRSGSPSRGMVVGMAVAVGIAVLGVALYFRPHGQTVLLPPAARYELRAWLREGAWVRLRALLQRAPCGAVPASILLGLGLLPLALGVFELFQSFTYALRLPNHLAALFPGPGIAVLLLGLMIGPLTAVTFLFDGLTFQAQLGSPHLGLRRPPVLSVMLLYVFVAVPALLHVHTVRLIDGAIRERKPLDKLFDQWVHSECAPSTGPLQPVTVAVSGGATRAGLWGAAVLDQVLKAQKQGGPSLFAVSSVSGGSLGTAGAMTLLSLESLPCRRATGLPELRPTDDNPVPLSGDALGPLLGGWLLNDIPRSAFEPIAAVIRSAIGHRPNGGDSAEAIEHAFEHLWNVALPTHSPPLKRAPEWDQPFLSLFYTDSVGTYRQGMPLWFANGTDATTGNRVITSPIRAPENPDDLSPWPFRGARDFHTLMRADVSIATAINNTARFPYLEPFGEMLPKKGERQVGSLVDGGYFENPPSRPHRTVADCTNAFERSSGGSGKRIRRTNLRDGVAENEPS